MSTESDHKAAIEKLRHIFERWYLKGIESTYKETSKEDSGSPLMAYILVSCMIDALAGYFAGRTQQRGFSKDYKAFLDCYVRTHDSGIADWLWQVRCNLAHDFTLPQAIALTHRRPDLHMAETTDGSIINFDRLWEVVKLAFNHYFDDVQKSEDLIRKFYRRSKALGSVGPKSVSFS